MTAATERLELEHTATLRTLVQYAGASGDFYEMHYDLPFAQERGHPELSVHGLLKAAWLGRLVDEWFRGRGRLVSFEVSYRGMDFRDQPVACGAEVVRQDGATVELELWTKNADGDITTSGAAVVALDDAAGTVATGGGR
ncbi:MAG TPA: MaoC/PaaZ C-terminal domain-containing protein [Nocardioides sp.]|nr:MaoC/PaaZ C-terminal domain-containing protein [Nocardioides sp.]